MPKPTPPSKPKPADKALVRPVRVIDPLLCWGPMLLIALAIVLCYAQVYGHKFVGWDDDQYLWNNERVQDGLTVGNVYWAFTTGSVSNWHPLTWITYFIDSQLFGPPLGRNSDVAGPMHVVNVVWHLANSCLLYWLLLRMTGAWGRSLFVALLFAVHPLHVESVAWLSERKDVLSTWFWLLTTLAYVRFVERQTWPRYLLVMLWFALGLMSKPMLVTLPCTLLLLDVWPLNRWATMAAKYGPARAALRLVLEKVPLFVLVVISVCATLYVQEGAMQTLERMPLSIRLANTAQSYLLYLWQMCWPAGLAPFYPYPVHGGSSDEVRTWFLVWGAAAAVAIVLISAACVWQLRRRPYLAVGWFWYLGTLMPVIGLVQVGVQARADRYTYVPLIGIFVAVTWLVADLVSHRRDSRFYLATTATLLVVACMVVTSLQVAVWRDSDRLFAHTLAVTENNDTFTAQSGVIKVIDYQGQELNTIQDERLRAKVLDEYRAAAELVKRAVDMRPDVAKHRYDYATILLKLNRRDEARQHLEVAIAISPDYPEALYQLGNMYDDDGLPDKAIPFYERAIEASHQKDSKSANNLGRLLSLKGQNAAALSMFEIAVAANAKDPVYRLNLARMLELTGQREKAVEQLKVVLQLQPGNPEALQMLNRLGVPQSLLSPR